MARGSQFVVTGRGGLPPTPAEVTRSEAILVDLGTPVQSAEDRASTAVARKTSISSISAPLVEASRWMVGEKGEVLLTASVPSVTPDTAWATPTSCSGS